MNKINPVVLAIVIALVSPVFVGADTLEFEDLVPGTVINNPNTFVTDGITVKATDFTWDGGGVTNAGLATVVNPNGAGANNGMNTNNVNLDFAFPFPLTIAGFAYRETGGNVNLIVNGILLNSDDFVDFDGSAAIPGIAISVAETFPGSNKGFVTVQGAINHIAFGGQELEIDDVRYVPTPSVLVMLGVGCVTMLRQRRKVA